MGALMQSLRDFLGTLRRPDVDLHEVRNAAQPLAVHVDFADTVVDFPAHTPDDDTIAVRQVVDAADPYPLSRRATAAEVTAAGITNGMDADQVEACLARVMR